jgi:hypothetical protein
VVVPLRLGLLLSGCLASLLQSAPAQATSGFTGLFDPSLWTLAVDGNTTTEVDCMDMSVHIGCVERAGAADGDVDIGAIWPGGEGVPATVVTWTWTNNSPALGYRVSFDYFVDSLNNYAFANIGIDGVFSVDLTVDSPFPPVQQALINPGGSLVFKVTAPISDSAAPAFLAVRGFSYEQNFVPAPLPAWGAASAFGLSRRLRRRAQHGSRPAGKGAVAPRRRASPAASPPHAYLCRQLALAPQCINQLPLSFHYGQSPQQRLDPACSSGPGRVGCEGL